MDDAAAELWSAAAADWARYWGDLAAPAQRALVTAMDIRPGLRVLDVGCGSGEFVQLLHTLGAEASGADPAPGMLAVARARLGVGVDARLRLGNAEALPWPDASFDAVTAVNALQFADDPLAALAEFRRVAVPAGVIGIANWAEGSRNDLEVVEAAVAEADGEDLRPDGELRRAGGLEELLAIAGLELVAAGLVETPWEVLDEEALVRGVLFGEEPSVIADLRPVVLAAASRFRTGRGAYRLSNWFRFAVGRIPG
ncbi:class I SAM-dependent methyltransferase [Naasia aerilata]|uniref:Methyltransferase type 11 domain-containing protein n=1 Tax=Naasia aerilata TaxID=1162966 RepID=A0ABN6XHL5_9MICO|nr:methyltransferase domain-containing protein [Naasia aerilata]BDZ44359.1 hypothetical protein GCM10025866_02680 [Naasia aerilata]